VSIPAIRKYRMGDRLYVQAQQIWLILVAYVKTRGEDDKKTLTYGELAEAMGHEDRRVGHTLSRQLWIISEYCRLNELPALNAIVVTQNDNQPGQGVVTTKGRSVREEQKHVYKTNWFLYGVPSTGTLRKVWASMA